jgi:hypothetical protein
MRSLTMALLLVLFPFPALAQKMPSVQIVFLTPADVDPPPGVRQRLTQVADCTESLLVEWMKIWDYPPGREKIFQRESDGSGKILFVKSENTLASGKFPVQGGNLSAEGRRLAIEKYKLPQNLDIWWVWVYLGDPPKRYEGFLGSGNSAQGGLAQVNYVNLPGDISPKDKLAGPFGEELTLKGVIHEFGHALGLPHNGPHEKQDLGMPLMGATIPNYRKQMKNQEQRVYLSEASAAILWKHPVFSGTADRRYAVPKVQWQDVAVENDIQKRIAHVTGKITTDIPAHTVIVYDQAPDVRGPYFQKAFTARIEKDGTFKVTISEPVSVPTSGSLKLVACCQNGTMTGGDGKGRGLQSAYELKYKTSRTGYQLIK